MEKNYPEKRTRKSISKKSNGVNNVNVKTKLTPLKTLLDYAEGTASTEFLLRSTGINRLCMAFSQGYTEHEIAEFYGASVYSVRNYLADISASDLRKTREAKRSFYETMITNLSSLGVKDLAMQYDLQTTDEDGEEIDKEDILQLQMKAAMLAEKRIKSVESMIKTYQRSLDRIDRLLDKNGSEDGNTVNHAVIINPNFLGILPP